MQSTPCSMSISEVILSLRDLKTYRAMRTVTNLMHESEVTRSNVRRLRLLEAL